MLHSKEFEILFIHRDVPKVPLSTISLRNCEIIIRFILRCWKDVSLNVNSIKVGHNVRGCSRVFFSIDNGKHTSRVL